MLQHLKNYTATTDMRQNYKTAIAIRTSQFYGLRDFGT